MLEAIQNLVATSLLRLPRPLLSWASGPPVAIDGQRLDPQVQMLLKLIAAQGGPQIHELPPVEARKLYRQLGPAFGGSPLGALVGDRRIPGPAGEIPLRVYTPPKAAKPAPLIVYYHGGGWVIGDLETHDPPCRDLAWATGAIVVAVDYRLAPEHRFPAAAEDAFAAYRWVAGHAAEIDADPARIAVAGDSAGGNLATVVCQLARDGGVRTPAFQALLYPTVDLFTEHRSWETFAEGFFLTRPTMRWFRDHYVPLAAERGDPRASPILGNLRGLPPAYLAISGFDVLRDEGLEYAERLAAAGVAVTLRREASLIHGWVSMIGTIREARRAFDDLAAALRDALAPGAV
jgi:acetyl esterase